jgi:hypothetical protein
MDNYKEIFEKVCLELEESWKGLIQICKENGTSKSVFHRYLNESEEARDRYARARELQLDYLEDLLREVVFNDTKDSQVSGTVNVGSNHISRDRLKADTLKFILAKLRANKYGAKVEVTHKEEPRVFEINKK